ncbi:MAG: hypothetical protein Q7T15_02760 [Microcella sp.]|uniref:hypothetical protein n=1 Tax=Microcella sp. TaxID=1913979 RepID=UPI002727D03B|nr:hypothetical protein [Microcella sp.]MDO8337160.1 hypothetical protein [Microcella sp.]
MSGDDALDRARALYGRPDPDRPLPEPTADARPADPTPVSQAASPPAIASEVSPRSEHQPQHQPQAEAQPALDEDPVPEREPRRTVRRGRQVAAATGILVLGAALTAVALVTEPQPSLAVFEREPTEAEREKLAELARVEYFGVDTDLSPRLLLEAPGRDASEPQRVWAIRLDGGQLGTPDGEDFVCLLLESFTSGPGDYGGCMLEADAARRGFVPLDQPRPSIMVEGELQVIQWGPTGDARLIDPPTLPGDGPSDAPSDGPGEADG